MKRLPVIVGWGGYNAAGRSSFHHGFRRMVIDSLDSQCRQETLAGLAVMTKLIKVKEGCFCDLQDNPLSLSDIESRYKQQVIDATLVRRIEKSYFDVDAAHWQQTVKQEAQSEPITFLLSEHHLPKPVPATWQLSKTEDNKIRVTLSPEELISVSSLREYPVKSAGQLPTNFNPAEHYKARFHPKGLQMAIMGVSDALHSVGIEWEVIKNSLRPDEIAVYASSGMGQLDMDGFGGMMKSRQQGQRVSAKQLALGLNSMPADFINAYVLGNVGTTGSITGACASFLYNLKNGIEAIQDNRARVVIVGCSEAPITPEIVDGYAAMGALATVEGLTNLASDQEKGREPDYRKASRPFGENCGFTLSESAQFFVLMDDSLAIELGAQVHGSVTDVFVNSDGFKKSIPAPGPGNYLTMAKAVAAATNLVGIEAVKHNSCILSHGSSTPQNRVTESEIFDRVAQAFDIQQWPVTAIKSYIGHPLAPASGDQLAAALGMFHYNLLPGIKTIERVADDVVQDRLNILLEDRDVSDNPLQVSFLNSKGFGGNNATAVVLSADKTKAMMAKRHGQQQMAAWQEKSLDTIAQAKAYDQQAMRGNYQVIYHFGQNMIDDAELNITSEGVEIPGFNLRLEYKKPQHYSDMV